MSGLSPIFRALANEASFVAHKLGSASTLIGKANSNHKGTYYSALLDLSVGWERALKLIIVTEYLLDNNGRLPQSDMLKSVGHDLVKLTGDVTHIAGKYFTGRFSTPPNSDVHQAILKVANRYAVHARYYNLDYLTQRNRVTDVDPAKLWWDEVCVPILQLHYDAEKMKYDQRNAQIIEKLIGDVSSVRASAVDHTYISSIGEALLQGAKEEVARKFSRMYVLQWIQWMVFIICEQSSRRYKVRVYDVPELKEFFTCFYGTDADFKRKKIWMPF